MPPTMDPGRATTGIIQRTGTGQGEQSQRNRPREIAAQRAAQHKREMRNRMLWTGGAILGVIVIVVAFIVIKRPRARPRQQS